MFKITIKQPDGGETTWDGNAMPDEEVLLRNRPAGSTVEVRAFTLEELIAYSKTYWEQMAPEEREAMLKSQRESFVRAEAGFGSDADEAAYRKALEEGDTETLERLNAEADGRVAAVDAYFGEDETRI